ncbi:hypothetical protein MMC30_004010 [Trapelia coarctata]|nr:hypothetical protein [Trapelia coarctata]
MDSGTQAAAMPPQKFSRYRSVRIAAMKEASPSPQIPAPPAADTVKRSMSRYRHARTKTAERIPPEPSMVVKPPIPPSPPKVQSQVQSQEQSSRRARDSHSGAGGRRDLQVLNRSTAHPGSSQASTEPLRSPPTRRRPTNEAIGIIPTKPVEETPEKEDPLMGLNEAQREAYAILNGDRGRAGKLHKKHRESSEQVRRETRGRKGSEARNLEGPRLQPSDQERQVNDTLHIKERANTVRKEAPLARDPRETTPVLGEVIEPPRSAEPGGTSQTPILASQAYSAGIDAPLSAVNAGERKILVKCNHSTIKLPVNPHTTAADILNSAINLFPGSNDARTMILVESFKQLGLERFLRRYEYIREVLNSWDHDDQNTLLVVPSPTDESDNDLDLKGAPTRQPSDVSVNLYWSQKPGTWDKRWITLRADGQVLMAKEKDGKDSKNICHMSDFDIYTPTSRQMRRLNPPKKYCFAIKSQQKSIMFISTANFVHFFATKDKVLAETWYKAVQAWRSWYLVHVMGNGQKPQASIQTAALAKDAHAAVEAPHQRQRSRTMGATACPTTDQLKPSATSNQIIQDFALPSAPPHAFPSARLLYSKSVRPSRDCSAPPVSFPRNFIEPLPTSSTVARNPGPTSSQGAARRESLEDSSSPMGILNRTYSQRKKTTHTTAQNSGPPRETSGLNHSLSKHQNSVPMFTPLVDLTPKYQDLPQHVKKGHGVIPDQIPVGGLVEIATSPNMVVEIPPAITHRRPESTRGGGGGRQRTATMTSTKAPLLNHSSPTDDETFPAGLLARFEAVRKQERAVGSGERPGGEPLLDMQEPSNFVPGSLLAGVEKQAGDTGPKIDRGKKKDGVLIAYGEAG